MLDKAIQFIDSSSSVRKTLLALELVSFFLSKVPLISYTATVPTLKAGKLIHPLLSESTMEVFPATPIIPSTNVIFALSQITEDLEGWGLRLLERLLLYISSHDTSGDAYPTGPSLYRALTLFFMQISPKQDQRCFSMAIETLNHSWTNLSTAHRTYLISALVRRYGAKKLFDEWLWKRWRKYGWLPLFTSGNNPQENESKQMVSSSKLLNSILLEELNSTGTSLLLSEMCALETIVKYAGQDLLPYAYELSSFFNNCTIDKQATCERRNSPPKKHYLYFDPHISIRISFSSYYMFYRS